MGGKRPRHCAHTAPCGATLRVASIHIERVELVKKRKPYFFIVAAVILLLAYMAVFGINFQSDAFDLHIRGANEMRFGIDIRGGVEAVFQPKDLGRAPTREELESAREIIESRLDAQNILDRDITIDTMSGHVFVRFPWKSGEADFDAQQAIEELGEMARLTFRDPDGNVLLEGKHVQTATSGYISPQQVQSSDQSGYIVQLKFTPEGAVLFEQATSSLVGEIMAIYMDEDLLSDPRVNSAIAGGEAQITGSFTAEQARILAAKIQAGALPFALETKNFSTISPTLGSGALDVMVTAALLAFGLICLFMLFYYRLPGFVACLALTLQISGQLLALSLPQITLTLPGIAGIILSIGMGVDANVIIAERIKEELKTGKTLDSAINSGFDRAFSSVFDGNITVMIVAIILMIFGSGVMLSFAYSLLTGVILNFVAGVGATRLMTTSLSRFKPLRNRRLYASGRLPE